MANKWVRCLHGQKIRGGPQISRVATQSLLLGGIQHFRAAHKISRGPTSGLHGYITRAAGGHSGGENQKWATSGQAGSLFPNALGIPSALERGTKSGVADKWAWSPT